MDCNDTILAHCTREFAESWNNIELTQPLLGGFVDAMAGIERFAGRTRI